jgi:hypothetical protein
MMRSKLRLVCFLILKSNALGMLRSALKNDSMALFIGAESFPCPAFQGNKYVVWSGNHLAIDSAAKGEWQR